MELKEVEAKLKKKLPDADVEDLLFRAKGILLSLKKADSIDEVPQRYDYWIYRACLELNEREDNGGSAIRYSENGYSVEYSKENLSSELIGEVFANVKFNSKT